MIPGIQKVLVDSKYKLAKPMNVMVKVVFGDMLQKTNQYDRFPTKRRTSSRDRYIKMIVIKM